MKRAISIFLLILFFLQSCYTYQNQPTYISKTVDTGRVKVEYQDGNKIVVKNIILDEDEYFAKYHGEVIKINNESNKKYYMLDIKKTKAKQNTLAVTVVVIPLAGLAILISALIKCADIPNRCT